MMTYEEQSELRIAARVALKNLESIEKQSTDQTARRSAFIARRALVAGLPAEIREDLRA